MSTIPYDQPEQDWDADPDGALPPRRPRRVYWNTATGVLLAAIACAVAFYAGVRVQKSQTPASTGVAAAGAFRRAAAAAGGGAGTGATTGARRGLGFGAVGGGAPGGGTFGTVASVSGKTLYVTGAGGNTVKVTMSGVTKVSKNLAVSRSSLRPGDTVVVQGVTGAKGTVAATSVADSGAAASRASTTTGGTSGSGSGSGGTSGAGAVNSLFGSGG